MKKKFQEVVINVQYGGFGLSDEAYEELIKMGWTVTRYTKEGNYEDDNADLVDATSGRCGSSPLFGKYSFARWMHRADPELRTHPDLIAVVKKLKKKANNRFCQLKIVKIPEGVEWSIEEYDGLEWVAEKHRVWG